MPDQCEGEWSISQVAMSAYALGADNQTILAAYVAEFTAAAMEARPELIAIAKSLHLSFLLGAYLEVDEESPFAKQPARVPARVAAQRLFAQHHQGTFLG
jgi:hypothetical protein